MYDQIVMFFAVDFGVMILLYCLKSFLLKDDVEDMNIPSGDRL
ncbi:hypothetical protein Lepto7376_0208 [[Leptolyngbya] sp. PCC 7376]|nr:hypothetical protein [[Leptolyngbya] sp. PCC 7376]AFY36653.1 hypothetical protein Lepto7376_0208 [[Leptolyngbya] sp. PCC 7376]